MWKCLNCGENAEDNFESCWSCGHQKDGAPRENQAEFDAARDEVLRTEDDSGDTVAGRFGRRLGRSRVGRIIVATAAVGVAALFFGLAALAQRHQKNAADLLAIVLVYAGLGFAWRVLPIPASVRARWAREEEQSEKGPLKMPYRFFFSSGFCLLLVALVPRGIGSGLIFSDFEFPLLLFAIGTFRFVLFQRSLRRSQSANDECNAQLSNPTSHPVP